MSSGLDEEAAARTAVDGIPRYITEDGKIMKCDWELSSELIEDHLDGETLEEHIASLIAEQQRRDMSL